jgi:D-beta-D-heptose 7-phosphate kinase/D-beta-D-heptose 1-phosphate adenosyltransferase
MTGGTAAKVRGRTEAVAWRGSLTAPVVFTNGVFDLLHPGHVELLEAARREGAALVVGVNSDASARRLSKGPGRPVAAQEARARVVAGLAAVDCVVLFEEDTPLELISALAPDVLVKGADYARDHIVGADWIEERGGRVVRVPLLSGYSTSALVERLRASS